jgi:hypothetical protein
MFYIIKMENLKHFLQSEATRQRSRSEISVKSYIPFVHNPHKHIDLQHIDNVIFPGTDYLIGKDTTKR